jgi:hypothetical protein
MPKRLFLGFSLVALALVCASAPAFAQAGLTMPASGGNQKASVTQWIGPVEVTVIYNSPDVTAPDGTDRTGHIWGELVPYGMTNLGFGSCGDQCPWRAGANENTVFTVSHDVLVQGQPLPAGSYGLHMIPGEETWTLVFSNDSTSWGSYFYDAAEDALRVETTPEEHPYTHWLDYEFTDRRGDRATVALQWENLQVPWTVEVPNASELYIAQMARDLRGSAGFTWTHWSNAANFAMQLGEPGQAVEWAQAAVSTPGVGQANFQTLTTLAMAQSAAGEAAASRETLEQAMTHPTASPTLIHGLGRQLLTQDRRDDAVWVWEKNAEMHSGEWPVEVGLMRGHSAMGRYDQALAHARTALEQAPDDVNRTSLEGMIPRLEAGEDIN